MIEKEELAKLREMDTRELSDHFGISNIKIAGSLKAAINPRRYEVLTDNRKTGQEMAHDIGTERRTVYSYRNLLKKYGIVDKGELISENSVISRLKKFLDKKPSDIYEIRKNVEGLYPDALYQNEEVTSIGPKNQRLYYLKNQKKIAEKELDKRFDKSDKLVLSALTKPMTVTELSKAAKTTYDYILMLESEGKLLRARRFCGGKKEKKIWLLEKDYAYKPGQEQDVANLVIQKIQSLGKLSRAEKQSITGSIKALPKSISEIAHRSYVSYLRSEDSEE
jgi:hypothetical protein